MLLRTQGHRPPWHPLPKYVDRFDSPNHTVDTLVVVTTCASSQTLPAPAGFPPQSGFNQYPAHYMNNGQYYQQNWSSAPPGTPPAPVPPAPVAAPKPPGAKDGQDFTQTATIRNSVNVKKDTIKLEPVEGDPTKLRISFSFDCTQPCCVTTYVCAHEDAETFKLTPRYTTPAACCIYEKGVRRNLTSHMHQQ